MFETLRDILLMPSYGFLYRPDFPFFWFYLVVTSIIALGVCSHRSDTALNNMKATIAVVFDPAVFCHRSAIADYRYVALNYLVSAGEVTIGLASLLQYQHVTFALLTFCIGQPLHLEQGLFARILLTISLFVTSDFANFYFHWLQHRIPSLWELHKVHHSAEVLTPLTALRVHPIATFLGNQFISLCMAVPTSMFLFTFDGPLAEVTIFGTSALVFLWHSVLGSHLAHSHVWVMYPKVIRSVLSSPALHLIHHSSDPKHRNKNLGFTLTIWDRLAGTLYQPAEDERHHLQLGLSPRDMGELRTVSQLYWTPIRNIITRQRRAMTKASSRQGTGVRH